jgi:DNA topoisomerase-1
MLKKEKTLIIVESPGKVKKIQEYLGNNYLVTASYGHIRDLDHSGPMNMGVNLQTFTPTYKIIENKRDKVSAIIHLASSVKEIYLATDPDREGEAIAWHLYFCLESVGCPIKRVKFNEITKKAIQKAVKNAHDLDYKLFESQQSRRVIDRVVGFMSSDYLRKYYNKNYSAGRVQSVAAKLIVDRESEISNFIPEEYWNVSVILQKNKKQFEAKLNQKPKNKKDAVAIQTKLNGATLSVKNIKSEKNFRQPNPPFITSSLQQYCSQKLNVKVGEIMKQAQSLYEAGLITYMRTDSTRCSNESIISAREEIKNLGFNVPVKSNNFSKGKASQDAHEAIRPTNPNVKPSDAFISDDIKDLYNLIWERFIASQMEPAEIDSTIINFNYNGIELKSIGKTIKNKGWLGFIKENEELEELPNISEKDSFVVLDVKLEQKFTQPPSRYTEASLVKELEKRGIGRPSTYASITETVKDRGYVGLDGKSYKPTSVGIDIINNLYNKFSFMKYDYTYKIEEKLDDISEGKYNYNDMMEEFFKEFRVEYREATKDPDTHTEYECYLCESPMVLKKGKFGDFLACSDMPFCKATIGVNVVHGIPIPNNIVDKNPYMNYKCKKCNDFMYLVYFGKIKRVHCMDENCGGSYIIER